MFENGFPSDWSTLKKLIWLRGSGAAGGDLPWQTFTGNPLEFDAPKAHALKSCVVNIEPIQDLHGQDAPYPSGGGKNKFDPSAMPTPSSTIQYHAFYVGDGEWMASTNAPYSSGNATVFFLSGDVSSGASTGDNGVSPTLGRTQTAVNGYVTIAWRIHGDVNPSNYNIQIESGSSISTWQPYSNICPISGWTEATVWRSRTNLFDSTKITTGKALNTNGQFTNSTASYVSAFIDVSALSTLYVQYEYQQLVHSGTRRYVFYGSNKTTVIENTLYDPVIKTRTITVPQGAVYFRITLDNNTTNVIICDNAVLSTLSVSWSDSAGTVYGGTLDVTTGVLTVTYKIKTLNGTGSYEDGQSVQRSSVSSVNSYYMIFDDEIATAQSNPIANLFKWGGVKQTESSAPYTFFVESAKATQLRFTLPSDSTMQTASDVNSWLATLYSNGTPLQFCVELATPTTIQLTPEEVDALAGRNVMWTDASNLTVEAKGTAVTP